MKKRVWITLLPLLAIFCSILAISLYFEKQRANSYRLDALLYEVTLNTESNLNEIINSLKITLLDQFEPCSSDSLLKLNDLIFENEHTRWAAILSNGQIRCETNRRNWLLDEPFNPKKHFITSQEYLASATKNNDTDTFIGIELGAYDVIVDIDLLDSIIDSCKDCAQFSVKLNTVPPFTITSDVKVQTQEGDEIEVDVNSGIIESLSVKTKPRIFNSWRLDNKFTITATLIALLLTIVLYVLYSKNVLLSFKIRLGIKKSEFVPYYQPIINTQTHSVIGAEVLMRWSTSTGKIVQPKYFIQHAEKTGLIVPQTYSMLEMVFNDMKKYKWDETALVFSINITPDFLLEDSFYYQLLWFCSHYDITPDKFAVEMTERQDILDSKQIRQAISKLRTLGVSVKLDDIGVGYSSLLYLVNYPIDTIKLDKSFIDKITVNPLKNLAIISTLIELATRLGMDVVAEGVETNKQVEYLRDRGVRLIQGYYFSKPVSNNLFNTLLSKKFDRQLKLETEKQSKD